MISELLKQHNEVLQSILGYFGYVQNWIDGLLANHLDDYWHLNGDSDIYWGPQIKYLELVDAVRRDGE